MRRYVIVVLTYAIDQHWPYSFGHKGMLVFGTLGLVF